MRLTWHLNQLDEAVVALIRFCGLSDEPITPQMSHYADAHEAGYRVSYLAEQLFVRPESIFLRYPDTARFLYQLTPTVLLIGHPHDPALLVLIRKQGKLVSILTPDGIIKKEVSEVESLIRYPHEAPFATEIDELLRICATTSKQTTTMRSSLLESRLEWQIIGYGWHFKPYHQPTLWHFIREGKLLRVMLGWGVLYGLSQGAFILAWIVLGLAVLTEPITEAWLIGAGLLMCSSIALLFAKDYMQEMAQIRFGMSIKHHLMRGALRARRDEVREKSVGTFLSQVMEGDIVDTIGLKSLFLVMGILIQIGIIFPVLWGVGVGWLIPLMLVWLVIIALLGIRYSVHLHRWTQQRLKMGSHLTEKILGHRTRLVQLPLERWHDDEDEILATYFDHATRLDNSGVVMFSLLEHGWLLMALIGIFPFLLTNSLSAGQLAITLASILLIYNNLGGLGDAIHSLATSWSSWRHIRHIVQADTPPPPQKTIFIPQLSADLPLITFKGVSFAYESHPILQNCTFTIRHGDKILLAGDSGSGKSTLAQLIAGQHRATNGTILWGDIASEGLSVVNWRRIAYIPQFHENYLYNGTLMFNLLLGRHMPPTDEDIAEAESVCVALGLGELLKKMPLGIFQQVGDSGWQLSHGERSRVFIARGLLQYADIHIFDESLVALDATTYSQVMACLHQYTRTILLIHH